MIKFNFINFNLLSSQHISCFLILMQTTNGFEKDLWDHFSKNFLKIFFFFFGIIAALPTQKMSTHLDSEVHVKQSEDESNRKDY